MAQIEAADGAAGDAALAVLALAGFLLIALGPLGVRYGVTSADVGLGAVALGGLLAVVAVGVALVAAVVARRRASRADRRASLPTVLLAAIALLVPAWTVARAWSTPATGPGGPSLILTGDPLETFGRAGRAAQEVGWTVEQVDEAGGRIKATDTSRWFRFTDDIEIRVSPGVRPEIDRDQVRVDVRSAPRTSLSPLWRSLLRLDDDGVNRRRTAEYLRRLASLR